MTLEEFAAEWGITRKSAQCYLANKQPWDMTKQLSEKRYAYDPKRIEQIHKERLVLRTEQIEGEIDTNGIIERYRDICVRSRVRHIIRTSNDFPKPIKHIQIASRTKAIWRIEDTDHYFKKIYIPPVLTGDRCQKKDVSRRRAIKGKMADSIYFCTGRNWRLGEPVFTWLYHYSEF